MELLNDSIYRQEASQIYVDSLAEFESSNQLIGLKLEYYLSLGAVLNRENLILIGPLGSGKTDIANLVLQKVGSNPDNTADLNLGFGASRTSLTGSQIIASEHGQEYIKKIFGSVTKKTKYLKIDELNRQNPDTLNGLLEALGHTNKVNENNQASFLIPGSSDRLILEDFRSVIATTNLTDRSDGTIKLGEPFLSRFDTGIHFKSKTNEMINNLGRLMLPSYPLKPFDQAEKLVIEQAYLHMKHFQLNEQQYTSLSSELKKLNDFWQKLIGQELSGRTIVKIAQKAQQLTYLNGNNEKENINFPTYTNQQLAIITRVGALLTDPQMDKLKEELNF